VRLPVLFCSILALSQAAPLVSQQPQVVDRVGSAVILKYSGGPVAFMQGLRVVSRQSSLQLEWYVVIDSSLGIVLDGPVGAAAWYDNPWHRYSVDAHILALDSIAAFEVRVMTFSVWRDFTGTLTFTQLEDLRPGQRKNFNGLVYGLYGESQLRAHTTSIAYIARVRHSNGRTVMASTDAVLRIARQLQAAITEQDLSPKPEPIPQLQRS